MLIKPTPILAFPLKGKEPSPNGLSGLKGEECLSLHYLGDGVFSMKNRFLIAVTLLAALFVGQAFAGTKECVEVVNQKRGTACGNPKSNMVAVKNTCAYRIDIFLCLQTASGRPDCFLQSNVGTDQKRYSETCEGNSQGSYDWWSRPVGSLAVDFSTTNYTSSAKSREESCAKVMALTAGDDGMHSECNCVARGEMSICRVQTMGGRVKNKSLIDPAIEQGRQRLREEFQCKPDDAQCIEKMKRNGGPAVRG